MHCGWSKWQDIIHAKNADTDMYRHIEPLLWLRTWAEQDICVAPNAKKSPGRKKCLARIKPIPICLTDLSSCPLWQLLLFFYLLVCYTSCKTIVEVTAWQRRRCRSVFLATRARTRSTSPFWWCSTFWKMPMVNAFDIIGYNEKIRLNQK